MQMYSGRVFLAGGIISPDNLKAMLQGIRLGLGHIVVATARGVEGPIV